MIRAFLRGFRSGFTGSIRFARRYGSPRRRWLAKGLQGGWLVGMGNLRWHRALRRR